jgi:predicted short-subunit dehydrogenase-like oxidoreductase (DUF2520 family)
MNRERNNNNKYKIVLIGSGNLASHLSNIFYNKGHKIIQVYSRNFVSAKEMAQKINAQYTTDLNLIIQNADIYILAVGDDAINGISKNLNLKNKLVIHTSGITDMNILKNISSNIGVLYPVQTFKKNVDIDYNKISVCIEANNSENLNIINNLAKDISQNIINLSSEKRKILHLAAVFACNFTNRMYAIAEDILQENNIPFEILIPLIEETANNIKKLSPKLLQTGPAVRKDIKTIEEHLNLLSLNSDYKNIYTFITKNILNETR